MTGALQLIPAALVPSGIALPARVSDAVAALSDMKFVSEPGERHQLLRRMDSKYAVPRARLPQLLQELAGTHQVLTAAGNPAAGYATVYFDTDDRRFLTDHLRGRRPRHKLRVRHYMDRELSFLEVKTRTPGDRTEKTQRSRDFGGNGLSTDEQAWASAATGISTPLRARAWSTCQRLTLLQPGCATRITIDLNVTLGAAGAARTLRDHVLVEVKQDRTHRDTALSQALRNAQARPVGLSKYVAAMMTAVPELPRARFIAVLGRFARPEYWGECNA